MQRTDLCETVWNISYLNKIFISESEVSLIYYYLGLALSCAGITSMTDVCSLQNHHSQLWGNETQNIFGVRFRSDPDRMQISSAEYGEIEYNYHRSLRHENWIGKCSTDSKLDTKNSYDVTCNWFLFHSPTLSSILFYSTQFLSVLISSFYNVRCTIYSAY